MEQKSRGQLARWEYLPPIGLYLDQVISYCNGQLAQLGLDTEDQRLSKSMVNNYVKARLLPPPEGKLYQPRHIAELIFISCLKTVLSIQDLGRLYAGLLAEAEDDVARLHNYFCQSLEQALTEPLAVESKSLEGLREQQARLPHFYSLHCAVRSFATRLEALRHLDLGTELDSGGTADKQEARPAVSK